MIGQLARFAIDCKPPEFFTLKPWYAYLNYGEDPVTHQCAVLNFRLLPENGSSDLLLVFLVIVDDLLRLAGIVAVGFVIYGGIRYATSQGSPEETAKAQSTILNALIGLLLAVVAIAVVSFIGRRLT